MSLLRGFTLLLALQLAGEVVVRLLGLSVPGPVAGLVLLLVGLVAWRPLAPAIEGAADTLLAHLSLLFVPAGVGVVVHLGRLDGVLAAVAVTLFGSTVIGLAVTALVLQALLRRSGAVPIERVGNDASSDRREEERRG